MSIYDKVIFLDIDGVITTPETNYISPVETCVQALNQLTEITGAKIVISSSWRSRTGIVSSLMNWGIRAEIIGMTPDLSVIVTEESPLPHAVRRGQEIQAWLDDNPVNRFVILDDDNDMLHLSDNLVQINPDVGLTEQDITSAIKLFEGGPINSSHP